MSLSLDGPIAAHHDGLGVRGRAAVMGKAGLTEASPPHVSPLIVPESLTAAAAQPLLVQNGMREILDIPVGELMSKPAVTVTPETSISVLTELMTTYDYNGLPVVTDVGTLVGLVTRTDLFKVYLSPYRNFIPAIEDTWVSSVGAIMSRGVITLYPVEPAIKAIALMVAHHIRTIPIVTDTTAGTTVIGVLTRRDLAAALKP